MLFVKVVYPLSAPVRELCNEHSLLSLLEIDSHLKDPRTSKKLDIISSLRYRKGNTSGISSIWASLATRCIWSILMQQYQYIFVLNISYLAQINHVWEILTVLWANNYTFSHSRRCACFGFKKNAGSPNKSIQAIQPFAANTELICAPLFKLRRVIIQHHFFKTRTKAWRNWIGCRLTVLIIDNARLAGFHSWCKHLLKKRTKYQV